jgi:short-subunit dehydrogenase
MNALVTGASAGIGLELARELAGRKFNLILVARDGEKLTQAARALEEQYGISARVLVKDLSNPASAREIYDELTAQALEVDLLINNAGFGGWGPFAKTDLSLDEGMIALNITALTQLTKLFIPGMVGRRRGYVMNVASLAAFQPGPFMAVYYATKAYVLSFSEALANELKGTGVTVTVLCPGPTRTGFGARSGAWDSRLFKSPMVQDAATVAKKGVAGMLKGKTILLTGPLQALLVFSLRLTPRAWVTAISRMIAAK